MKALDGIGNRKLTRGNKRRGLPAGSALYQMPNRSTLIKAFTALRFTLICCSLVLLPRVVCEAAIDFWHPWPHADRTVRSLASSYSRQYGVTVRVRTFNPSSYRPWTGKSSPDLIGLSRPSKTTITSLAASGRINNLQPQMIRGWYSRFWPGLLDTFTIRKQGRTAVYGIPLTGQVHVFVYNKALFKRAGVSAPIRTWQDLMSASGRLRRAGITPYAGGFGSSKPPLAHSYEWSYLGLHNLTQTYNRRYPYNSRQWIQYLNLYTEMRVKGFTNANWASVSESTAAKYLLNGRVAMIFTGPGFESIRGAYRPQFNDWGIFTVPVDRRARYLPRLPGQVVEGLVINQRSRQKTAAIKFAMWLSEPRQQVILANGASAVPSNPAAGSDPRLHQHIRTFASVMRDQSVDLRVYENPRVLRIMYQGVRNILRGRATPTSVANATQREKRR